jgi:phosphoenolpyruvate carboxykinase (GTP)
MVEAGTLIKLNPAKRPNSYLCRSDPADVARVEDRTFICSANRIDAGPNNNWVDPKEMRSQSRPSVRRRDARRTMYVIPSAWGRSVRRFRISACSLPDSPLCGVSMRVMTRMGEKALTSLAMAISCTAAFGRRAVGARAKDVPWPCNAEHKYIVHFP